MAHILIVDDEEKIRDLIEKYLIFEGFEVSVAENGLEGLEIFWRQKIDLLIVDIMMDGLDGYSMVEKIRQKATTPIIMLSAKGEEFDKIYGFTLGIDDYVTKPFSPKELVMRVKAVLDRTLATEITTRSVVYQDLEIDKEARLVKLENEYVNLTPKEYDLLFYMMEHQNIALSRDVLMEKVWGFDYFGTDRTLDTHVKSLRKALKTYGRFIVTVRGVGYRFQPEVI